MKWIVVWFLVMSVFPSPSYAQAPRPGAKTTEQALTGPRKQLATIIFAGLAGSIMGLSTLSFYGRPQDHLENIAVGFAVGVIGGTAYVTYKAAMQPEDFYGTDFNQSSFNRDGLEVYRSMASHKGFGPIVLTWTF